MHKNTVKTETYNFFMVYPPQPYRFFTCLLSWFENVKHIQQENLMQSYVSRRISRLLPGLMLLAAANVAYADKDSRDAVHNDGDSVVVNSFDKCVRTKWSSADDECHPPTPKPAPVVQEAQAVIGQEERTVYFDFNKTVLTPDSQTKLNNLAEKLKSDKQVRQARVFGYADRIGKAGYNQKLSEKRAEVVSKYLISRGFTNARVTETRWFGAEHPATNCADTLKRSKLIECLQKDRRVEVEIDYTPVTANQ